MLVWAMAWAGCGSPPRTEAPPPPPICRPAVTLGAGPYFTDVTDAMGLGPSGLALTAVHFTLVDLDGDGLPDLVSHPLEGTRPTLDAAPPAMTWRVLMNRPSASGGRAFVDATIDSGYGGARDGSPNRAANFAVAGDFDNDGDLDLLSGLSFDADFGDRNDVALNDGAARFTLAPASDLSGGSAPWHTTSAAALDYDRDGRLDVYVGFWYQTYPPSLPYVAGQQDRLYRGLGDGTFVEMTDLAGLTTSVVDLAGGANHRPTYGVSACDVDDDGWPDLVESAYGRQWNQLFHNGAGVFTDLGRATGFAADALIDYTDNEFYRCWCDARGGCAGVPPAVINCAASAWNPGFDDQPWRLGGNTFATVCGDVDNDGDLDLYNAEIKHWHIGQSSDGSQLLVNEPDTTNGAGVRFDRPGVAATGLVVPHFGRADWNEGGLGATMLDFDADGDLDVYLAASDYPDNYGYLYRGAGDGRFTEMGATAGVDHECPSGLAIADLDGDGDEDLVVGSSRARNCATRWPTHEVHVYRNDVGQDGNALSLRLVGTTGSNRAAIGARVRVTAGGRTLRRDVQGGFGLSGISNDLVLTIGLGDACTADVEVRWPDAAGTIERYAEVRANYRVEIRQGEGVRYVQR